MIELHRLKDDAGIKVNIDEEALIAMKLQPRIGLGEEIGMVIGKCDDSKQGLFHEAKADDPGASILRMRTDGRAEVVFKSDQFREYQQSALGEFNEPPRPE